MYSFLNFEPVCCSMFSSNCCFLTWIQASQVTDKVVCYFHLLKNFPQFVVTYTGKVFGIINKAEVNVFLGFPYFFYDQTDTGNLISGSSAFSKSSLYIWKFSVHVLLKPSLKDFKYYLADMWDDCNCAAIFGIALLWDWNENWPFPVCNWVMFS